MEEERGNVGGAGLSDGGPNTFSNMVKSLPGRDPVGPDFSSGNTGPRPNPFSVGHGVKQCKRADKILLGSRSRRARSHQSIVSSPVDIRPLKRPRSEDVIYEPGFGFTGFCTSAGFDEGGLNRSKEGADGGLDLNLRASSGSSETGAASPRAGSLQHVSCWG
ncbi:hypothetical protein Hanom_Chr08g00740841 [Helianthus anomalus]